MLCSVNFFSFQSILYATSLSSFVGGISKTVHVTLILCWKVFSHSAQLINMLLSYICHAVSQYKI